MRLTSVSAPRTKSHASFTRLVPICMKKYPTSAHVASAHRASPPPVVAKADPTRKGTVAAVSVLGRAAAIHAAMPAFLGLDDGFASGVTSSFEAFAATRADLRSAMVPSQLAETTWQQKILQVVRPRRRLLAHALSRGSHFATR